jgi:hypothetical protein
MKSLHNDKLLNIFRIAYKEREKQTRKLDEQWQEEVMNRIKALELPSAQPSFLSLFERSVWRLAPVVCVLILFLAFLIQKVGLVPEYEMTRIFVQEPLESTMVLPFFI